MALLLARPEYLKLWTPRRLPGSLENWTDPSLFVCPRFTRNELLSLIRCQIKLSDAMAV
jgi:hypothetical protein